MIRSANDIPDDYVQMEQHVCPICNAIHTHGTGILISKRLRSIPKEKTVTDYGLCYTHDEMSKEFIAVVETQPPTGERETLKLAEAERTGNYAHVRREAFPHIFNAPCPDRPFVFVEVGIIDKLKAMQMEENDADTE